MGDPGGCINLTGLHHSDDVSEVCARGIAARQYRQFPAMEIRVVERDITQEEADKDQFAAGSNEIERIVHGS